MENSHQNYKLGSLVDGKARDYTAIEKMTEQIEQLGGMLHFTISKDEDGWSAQCKEVAGIITGGANPAPTDFEIESNIREAIFTAFHVETTTSSEFLKTEVAQMALSVSSEFLQREKARGMTPWGAKIP